jgi:hypothetical protein
MVFAVSRLFLCESSRVTLHVKRWALNSLSPNLDRSRIDNHHALQQSCLQRLQLQVPHDAVCCTGKVALSRRKCQLSASTFRPLPCFFPASVCKPAVHGGDGRMSLATFPDGDGRVLCDTSKPRRLVVGEQVASWESRVDTHRSAQLALIPSPSLPLPPSVPLPSSLSLSLSLSLSSPSPSLCKVGCRFLQNRSDFLCADGFN